MLPIGEGYETKHCVFSRLAVLFVGAIGDVSARSRGSRFTAMDELSGIIGRSEHSTEKSPRFGGVEDENRGFPLAARDVLPATVPRWQPASAAAIARKKRNAPPGSTSISPSTSTNQLGDMP